MNSRTFGTAILVLGLSVLVSACDQREPDQLSNDTNAPLDADSVAPEEHAAANVEESVLESSTQPRPQQEQGSEDQNNGESAKEDNEKTALVEDMGFSTETTTEIDVVEDVPALPFCLGNSEVQHAVSVVEACDRISNKLASVSGKKCIAANLQASSCQSVSGFPIFYREFPPLEDRKPQGRILVIGGIHGDELTSVSIVFKWIAKLNKFHSGLFHWHVVPIMNPDGVLQKSAKRTNKNGVDLNRNLPSVDWEENALHYWRDKQGENPRRYPGEKPASEPETQWLIDEINAFKPDAIISVHAPYGVVDFDALLLNTAPKSLGKLHLNLLGTYPGSLGNYAGIDRDIPVITLELPHAWEMPSEQETTKIWEDIVSWLRKNVNTEIADVNPETTP